MKLFLGNKLGRQLALAALALCFFAIPGKAQDAHKSTPEVPVCTSYPEWSCEPQTTPSNEAAPVTKAETHGPSCTSYPEWSCEPQTMPGQVKTKPLAKRKGRESKGAVSDSTGGSDEAFERRSY